MRKYFIKMTVGLVACGLLCIASASVADDVWIKKDSTNEPIWAAAGAGLDDMLYVSGGRKAGGTPLKTMKRYDPEEDGWDTVEEMEVTRFRHASCAVNGRIYVIGGTQDNHGSSVLASVEEYDPDTDKWTVKADMPTPRHSLTVSVVNGKIYAIGGAEGSVAPSTWTWVGIPAVEVYDPATDSWEKKADMPDSRAAHAAGVVRGRIYILGGISGTAAAMNTPETVQEYDPVNDIWAEKAPLQVLKRAYHDAVAVNGKIYVVGGGEGEDNGAGGVKILGYTPDTEEYDPATDTWSNGDNMPTTRTDMAIGVVDGKIYAVGGWKNGAFLSVVEEYTPPGWPFPVSQSVSPQGKLVSTWATIKTSPGF